jgi:hypothetical protein
MSKFLKYGIITFLCFLTFSIVVFCVSKANKEQNISNKPIEVNLGELIDVEKVINSGKWHEITEEDKITLALSSETNIISEVKTYLKNNKIAIFFVYGGPFDYGLKGNYIICTGFNDEGKVKILYPDDNYATEWIYSFEGLIEFSYKVMLFEM